MRSPAEHNADAVAAAPTDLTADEALSLLRAGEADFDSGRLDSAAGKFERLIAAGLLDEWAHFFLGRVHREAGRQDEALAAFDAAIARDRTLFWAHYERLRMHARRNAAADLLGALARDLVAIDWLPMQAEHVEAVSGVAHRLWDEGDRALGGKLLARLWPSEALDQLALNRIVEAHVDVAAARGAAARLASGEKLNEATLRLLADHHQRTGDLDGEIAILEKRRAAAPKDFQTWLGLVRSYAKKGDRERAAATLAAGNDFPARQQTFVRLIMSLELGDVEPAFHEFRTHARLYAEVPKFPGIRLAYQLGDMFDTPRRNEVLALIDGAYPDDQDVALVKVNAAMRDQRWDDARALFEHAFPDLEGKPQSVRLTHIDILAFSGRLEEAATLLEAERVDGRVPPSFLRSTLRILSELDRWNDVFDVGLAHLGEDTSFEHFLSVMIRAARKTGRETALFDGLLALPRPLKRQQLDALHAVMEDLAEQGQQDIVSRIGDLPLPYERQHRIELKLRVAAGVAAGAVEKDLCIFYCADKNYLMPALVSLTALALSNVSITRRAVFNIVVDSDVVPLAQEATRALARRLGLAIEVTDAATIVSSADRLRTSYGIFTGGQQLALAAYYRIFFARHVVDQKRFAQALYIDADTIIRSGLDELFAIERKEPLLARYETDRPEVRHATQVHGLKGRYFNSGVLRFDLNHPDLPKLLDDAIAAAIDPDVQLIFQDQCALNIAFDTRMSELPERFNYFNPPSVSGDDISQTDAVIVHFLDRPKPWDSLYRRRAREWFEWYDLVQMLRQDLPEALAAPIAGEEEPKRRGLLGGRRWF